MLFLRNTSNAMVDSHGPLRSWSKTMCPVVIIVLCWLGVSATNTYYIANSNRWRISTDTIRKIPHQGLFSVIWNNCKSYQAVHISIYSRWSVRWSRQRKLRYNTRPFQTVRQNVYRWKGCLGMHNLGVCTLKLVRTPLNNLLRGF